MTKLPRRPARSATNEALTKLYATARKSARGRTEEEKHDKAVQATFKASRPHVLKPEQYAKTLARRGGGPSRPTAPSVLFNDEKHGTSIDDTEQDQQKRYRHEMACGMLSVRGLTKEEQKQCAAKILARRPIDPASSARREALRIRRERRRERQQGKRERQRKHNASVARSRPSGFGEALACVRADRIGELRALLEVSQDGEPFSGQFFAGDKAERSEGWEPALFSFDERERACYGRIADAARWLGLNPPADLDGRLVKYRKRYIGAAGYLQLPPGVSKGHSPIDWPLAAATLIVDHGLHASGATFAETGRADRFESRRQANRDAAIRRQIDNGRAVVADERFSDALPGILMHRAVRTKPDPAKKSSRGRKQARPSSRKAEGEP